MAIYKQVFLILFLFSSVKTFAYTPREGKVSATLGPFFYKTNFEGSPSGAKSPLLGGEGLIANGDISDYGSLEVAMFHMNKIYFREQAGQFISEQTELIHFSLGYRYWFSSYFSAATGFYSAYSMGDPKTIHSDFAPGTVAPDTSARDTTEYGFDFALQTELWSRDKLSVVLDGRYSLSVTNKLKEHSDHYGVLVGIKYVVQEKYPDRPAPLPPANKPTRSAAPPSRSETAP